MAVLLKKSVRAKIWDSYAVRSRDRYISRTVVGAWAASKNITEQSLHNHLPNTTRVRFLRTTRVNVAGHGAAAAQWHDVAVSGPLA